MIMVATGRNYVLFAQFVTAICYGDSFIAMADLYYMNQISLKIAYMDTDCVANGLILCGNELQK